MKITVSEFSIGHITKTVSGRQRGCGEQSPLGLTDKKPPHSQLFTGEPLQICHLGAVSVCSRNSVTSSHLNKKTPHGKIPFISNRARGRVLCWHTSRILKRAGLPAGHCRAQRMNVGNCRALGYFCVAPHTPMSLQVSFPRSSRRTLSPSLHAGHRHRNC